MEIFTITYVSLYGGQLWSETKVYNDRELLKIDYKEYVGDIADKIDDDEEKDNFLKDYYEPEEICHNVHWENWDGTEMYMLITEIQTIQ